MSIKSTAAEYPDGHKEFYLYGKLHRIDGPAVEYPDGHKAWFLNGKYHREDGPAIEHSNGSKEWWLNGNRYSQEEFREEIKLIIAIDKQIQILEEEIQKLKDMRQGEK